MREGRVIDSSPSVRGRSFVVGAFVLAVLAFLTLKAYSFHFETGDENVYLYMAWATARHGAWPYRDYFFAHPPLHLVPGILLFFFADVGPVTARAIPILATIVGAVLLLRTTWRCVGPIAALVAVVVHLSFAVPRIDALTITRDDARSRAYPPSPPVVR